MRSLIPRRAGAALALVLAVAATAACSAATTSSAQPSSSATGPVPPIHLAHVSNVTDSASLVYPIDAYLLTNDQTIEFDQATNLLEDQCMAEFGFTYTAPPPNVLPGTVTDTNAPRRYGISDAAQVARLGYHPPPNAPAAKKPDLPPTGLMVLTGSAATDASPSAAPPAEYAGRALPSGGCIGQARAQLTAHGGSVNADPAAEQINEESLSLSEREPQVIAVTKQWSQCMVKHGYHYAVPYDAGNDTQWDTPEPSATEIRTATTDVACKAQTNLVGIWYAVETALQREMITANQQHLDQVRQGIAAQTAAAGKVLATAA
jgi:hypothetical protein